MNFMPEKSLTPHSSPLTPHVSVIGAGYWGKNLVRLAAERQKTLFVGHILHYHAAVIRLKEMIKAGEIGRLQ